ncbi:acyl-CoA thioesterase [Paludisphaera mucosa]|uniref:Thioesterase family protein n=1 Tax=Paludisphaera mucosa TaxID=3030827 RepID=A0ABT6FG12_9BACT|nr:thioesterase family protein [Paludisphaera mucosa]MDG3006515.1 thioesterase family protein [Paludisphaera mucosa]
MSTPDEMEPLLADYRVVIEQPVQWGEQDLFGHVNHVHYFRWYESSRIAYAERVGLMHLHRAERIGPILASIANDYRRQLTFPDTVHVGVRVTRIGVASISLEHKIFSRSQQALAAEGTSTLVIFDYTYQRPTRVPETIRKAIEEMEGREFPRS